MVDANTFMMTDEEVEELGRMTLHGNLPQTTVMRLFNAAIRLLGEKRELEVAKAERDMLRKDLEKAVKKRTKARSERDEANRQVVEMTKQRDVACANYNDALRDVRGLKDAVEALREDLKKARAEVDQWKKNHAQIISHRDTALTMASDAERKLEEEQRRVESLVKDRATMQDRAIIAERERDEARAERDEAIAEIRCECGDDEACRLVRKITELKKGSRS